MSITWSTNSALPHLAFLDAHVHTPCQQTTRGLIGGSRVSRSWISAYHHTLLYQVMPFLSFLNSRWHGSALHTTRIEAHATGASTRIPGNKMTSSITQEQEQRSERVSDQSVHSNFWCFRGLGGLAAYSVAHITYLHYGHLTGGHETAIYIIVSSSASAS